MTTDAEYRALAERLANLDGDQADTALMLSDDTASAILALLEERDRLYEWKTKAEQMDREKTARVVLAESRLGKAVDLLQRTINGPVSADTHEKEWALFDETMAFLSDLEKSE